MKKYRKYAPALLRIAMSLVFLWFGISQIARPNQFIGYLPKEAGLVPLAPGILITLNGIFETILGSLLILGFFTRIAGFFLAAHLALITLTLGFTELGVRDFGLTLATFAVVLNGPDEFSLETRLRPKK